MKFKKTAIQIFFVAIVVLCIFWPLSNLISNLEKQNIASGFFFLNQEAGFEISESIIEYDSFMSYGRALIVGLVNTLKVAVFGNVLAFFLGVVIGVLSLSKNWLLSKVCLRYVNVVRNVPLLLQLFFWYALFTDVLPSVRQSYQILGVIVSNRGVVFPFFNNNLALVGLLIAFSLSLIIGYFFHRWAQTLHFKKIIKRIVSVAFILGIFIMQLELLMQHYPLAFPEVRGFNVQGGITFSPELASLLIGLVIYTGAFIAEIVRAGILSIPKGQWEASFSLGLDNLQTLKLVILPQSFKLSLPPLISQFLNLTKNSSLAVAIGYPDFVSVANTTMNQTGQAVELIALIMLTYLALSLLISSVMNLVNKRIMGRQR